MAIKTVEYGSCQKLACADTSGAQVVLCLDPSKVASRIPLSIPASPTIPLPTYSYSTIVAEVYTYETICGACCGEPGYRYTFQYDDSQVVDAAQLVAQDILGIACIGCLMNYVRDEINAAIVALTEAINNANSHPA